MKYEEIEGDLITLAKKGNFDIIAHGCNCFTTMGAGIAKTIKEEFPKAFEIDCETEKGDIKKLGTWTGTLVRRFQQPALFILNLYTQYGHNPKDLPFDYEAFTLCLRKINTLFKGLHIGLPQIGCGLAGGDWDIIKKLIQREITNLDVTVVIYKK